MKKRDLAQQAATGNGEFRTKAVRAGHHRTGEGEHAEAMFMTSSFCFPDAESAKAAFVDDSGDNVYSRFDNPTVQAFEERLAALEGADRCVATASGMAATLALGMAHLQAGDRVVCSRAVFGSTLNLWTKYFGKFGVEIVTVDPFDLSAWESRCLTIRAWHISSHPPILAAKSWISQRSLNVCMRWALSWWSITAFVRRPCSAHWSWVRTWSVTVRPSSWMDRVARSVAQSAEVMRTSSRFICSCARAVPPCRPLMLGYS